MNKYTLLSFLFPLVLSAEITTSSVTSKQASYSGNTLILEGNVKLTHPLGDLRAGNARLHRNEDGSTFSNIHLTNDVLIALRNRGMISCGKADFDFEKLKGTLYPSSSGMVEFSNTEQGPISIASKQADIEFIKVGNELQISKIEAQDRVELIYGDGFILQAGGATYSNTKTPYVWASPDCILTHYDDEIQAERVDVLPESEKFIFSKPHGKLSPSAFSQASGAYFSCDSLVWEQAPQILTLKGNVEIIDEGVGKMNCVDEIELRQKLVDGKWVLGQLMAKGKTELSYLQDEKMPHLLICNGEMQLDQDRLILTLASPPNEPLEYYHDQMKLTADHAELNYTQGDKTIHPQRLSLCGNIELTSSENQNRCGVADQFFYYPETKQMVLSSKEGKNVLFWDGEQQLSISAREVHITETERGESIKGIGNVRFAFSSAEHQLLKKLFPFYQRDGSHHE